MPWRSGSPHGVFAGTYDDFGIANVDELPAGDCPETLGPLQTPTAAAATTEPAMTNDRYCIYASVVLRFELRSLHDLVERQIDGTHAGDLAALEVHPQHVADVRRRIFPARADDLSRLPEPLLYRRLGGADQ